MEAFISIYVILDKILQAGAGDTKKAKIPTINDEEVLANSLDLWNVYGAYRK